MIELDDQELRERFTALVASPADADWDDVVRRARRSRRARLAPVFLAAVAAIVVTATAFGLDRTVLDWFSTEPAPDRVQIDFLQLGVGAPAGMDPGIVPNSARKVTVVEHDGKSHVLWVAPTRQGGFCWLWTKLSGSCRRDRTEPVVSGRHPLLLAYSSSGAGVVQWVEGTVLAGRAERIVAHYADGFTEEIPILWVSPPIDAGFYIHWLPAEHRRPGHQLNALVAEDADGKAVARQTFRLTPPGDLDVRKRLPNGETVSLPAKALADQARPIIDFTAENGRQQTLWLMPTSEGGQCYLFNRGFGCPPKDFESEVPLAGALASGSAPILYFAHVRDQVAAVELRYQDGEVERIEPTEGFVLHEIGSAHYPLGHRLELEVAYGRDGRELARQPHDPAAPGIYPCDKPVDQGHGKMMCP